MKPSIQDLFDQLKRRIDDLENKLKRTDVQLGHRLIFNKSSSGEVPASPGGTAKFLREDAKWITVAGGGFSLPMLYAPQFTSGQLADPLDPPGFDGPATIVMDAIAGAQLVGLKAKPDGTVVVLTNDGATDIFIGNTVPTDVTDKLDVGPTHIRPSSSLAVVYDATQSVWRRVAGENTVENFRLRSIVGSGTLVTEIDTLSNFEGRVKLGTRRTIATAGSLNNLQRQGNVLVLTNGQTVTGINNEDGLLLIRNGGSANVTLANESGLSTVGNYIVTPDGSNYTISPGHGVIMLYGEPGSGGGAGAWHIVSDIAPAGSVQFSSFNDGVFEGGFDGDIVFDGTSYAAGVWPTGSEYRLARDILAQNINVNAGVKVDTRGWRLFAKRTVFLSGTIHRNGNHADRGGGGGVGGTGYFPLSVGGSSGGAAGNPGGAGTIGANISTYMIGATAGAALSVAGGPGSNGGIFQGGAGGGSGSLAGANGGTVTIRVVDVGDGRRMLSLIKGEFDGGGDIAACGTGGGGGRGGGGQGGGSGAPGGYMVLAAREIKVNGTGSVEVKGGDGAQGGWVGPNYTTGGGGGGGAGGILVCIIGTGSFPPMSVAGGAGGAGGPIHGYAGGTGGPGLIFQFYVGTQ